AVAAQRVGTGARRLRAGEAAADGPHLLDAQAVPGVVAAPRIDRADVGHAGVAGGHHRVARGADRVAAAVVLRVGLAVAVVVERIAAHLGAGRGVGDALQAAALAWLRAGAAHAELSGVARGPATRIAFVDHAVAVVVEAVAALAGGRADGHAVEHAAHALLNAGAADPQLPGAARAAAAGVAVVDHAVAIVVDAVADLR